MERTVDINKYEPMYGPGWSVHFTLPEWITTSTNQLPQEEKKEVILYTDWKRNDAGTTRSMMDEWVRKWKNAIASKPVKPTIYGYVARNKNGTLWFFTSKPVRNLKTEEWDVTADGFCTQMDPIHFPEIEWDSKPKGFVVNFDGIEP